MMDWTDRHCRYFHRILSKQALLYTEMITTGALIHGDKDRFLHFHTAEHPVAIQLGGCDPKDLAVCAKMAEDAGYDEVNLNVGCPSDRVQSGQFGLALMKQPGLVANCIKAMKQAVTIPVTVKTRTGVDNQDNYAHLKQFVTQQVEAGADQICIHARKGWLKGLSPKQNRNIPPLQYERVYRVKQDFPTIDIGINGGILSLDEAEMHLQQVDAVMIGREAYQHPYTLADVDQRFFGCKATILSRPEVVNKMCSYIENQLAHGVRLNHITRHMLGLFHGQPVAKSWRRYLSQYAHLESADVKIVLDALRTVQQFNEQQPNLSI